MTALSEAASTFLTRKVTIDRDIVTYRTLSRELSIHVNEAKKWLEQYLEQARGSQSPVHATYVVTGEVQPTPVKQSPIQDEDGSGDSQMQEYSQNSGVSASIDEDAAPTWQMLLAPEDELEQCKGSFARVASVGVYSLSPGVVKVRIAILVTGYCCLLHRF
ncbi:hypothetical protein DL93DRAFT_1417919 [Clavulina sp. PMI_390]|nr:hypothetical protein DL93DRAFT_1417919 [Clavulina sp. PMI_390]